MFRLDGGLYVGNIFDYDSWRGCTVSCTKTVHREIVGEQRPGDVEYLVARRPGHLILNWVDGPARLFEWSFQQGVFSEALDFIELNLRRGEVLVHCDAGMSRSPTLSMLYLAKRGGVLPNNFLGAAAEFRRLYPRWMRGGISDFVQRNWGQIN